MSDPQYGYGSFPHKKGILCDNGTRSDADDSRIEAGLLYKKKISMNFDEMVSRD